MSSIANSILILDKNVTEEQYMNMNSYICCQSENGEFKQMQSLAEILQLVAEPNRLRILCLLRHKSHCVCDMQTHFQISQSLLSHHLADLRQAQLLNFVKDGRRSVYSLTNSGQLLIDHLLAIGNVSQ